MSTLFEVDPEVYRTIEEETRREAEKLVLIASENYASEAVLEAQGSIMTNKYAEGYPGKRFYGGCEYVDKVERLAIERAKELFEAEHANVQPNTGSAANMAVYLSILQPGDTILGMRLSHGGHLTHGAPVSFSGRLYHSFSYGVSPDTGTIDYDEVRKIALSTKPKMIIAGASSYSRIIDFRAFREIADEINAYLMVDMAHIAGLVAARIHPSPVPYADFVTATTHKTLRGPRGGLIICKEKYAKIIDQMVFPGIQGGPLMHVIAAKAVTFKEAMTEGFKEYQLQIVKNARSLAENLMSLGYDIVSGGTDTHLFLVDLTRKGITGKEAEESLDISGITVNKNAIPFEKRSLSVTSGIRIGTPVVTTRGMKEEEMKEIAHLIHLSITNYRNREVLEKIRSQVRDLCGRFPIYQERLMASCGKIGGEGMARVI